MKGLQIENLKKKSNNDEFDDDIEVIEAYQPK